MATNIKFCQNCGAQNSGVGGHCTNCGANVLGYAMPPERVSGGYPAKILGAENKLPAGICGIILGAFGVHKFILGYTTEGITMLAISLVGFALCGIPTAIVGTIGLIEGIIYLTKTDEEFVQTYVQNKKGWF